MFIGAGETWWACFKFEMGRPGLSKVAQLRDDPQWLSRIQTPCCHDLLQGAMFQSWTILRLGLFKSPCPTFFSQRHVCVCVCVVVCSAVCICTRIYAYLCACMRVHVFMFECRVYVYISLYNCVCVCPCICLALWILGYIWHSLYWVIGALDSSWLRGDLQGIIPTLSTNMPLPASHFLYFATCSSELLWWSADGRTLCSLLYALYHGVALSCCWRW